MSAATSILGKRMNAERNTDIAEDPERAVIKLKNQLKGHQADIDSYKEEMAKINEEIVKTNNELDEAIKKQTPFGRIQITSTSPIATVHNYTWTMEAASKFKDCLCACMPSLNVTLTPRLTTSECTDDPTSDLFGFEDVGKVLRHTLGQHALKVCVVTLEVGDEAEYAMFHTSADGSAFFDELLKALPEDCHKGDFSLFYTPNVSVSNHHDDMLEHLIHPDNKKILDTFIKMFPH